LDFNSLVAHSSDLTIAEQELLRPHYNIKLKLCTGVARSQKCQPLVPTKPSSKYTREEKKEEITN